MVTSLFRLQELRVRFPAPHPIIICIAACLLCCTLASASDLDDMDYYADSPQTLAARAVSSQTLFGVGFSYDTSTELVTKIGQYGFTAADIYTQRLATEVYDLALGIDSSFSALDLSNSAVIRLLEMIYDEINTNMVTKGDFLNFLSQLDVLTSGSDWSYAYSLPISGYSATGSRPSYSYVKLSGSGLFSLLSDSFDNLFGLMGNQWDYGLISFHRWFLANSGSDYLLADGTISSFPSAEFSVNQLLTNGFQGLASLIAGQWGATGFKGQYTWVNPEDPDDYRTYEISSLFDLAAILGDMEKSLARLEFVLANADDIALKRAVEEVTDAFKDNFTGSGDGAVSAGDISDMAGISSDLSGGFGGSGVTSSDVFTALKDNASYSFFSQEVSDALDTVSSSAVAVDDADRDDDHDFLDDFIVDDAGFYSVADLSPWDISAFLGRDLS